MRLIISFFPASIPFLQRIVFFGVDVDRDNGIAPCWVTMMAWMDGCPGFLKQSGFLDPAYQAIHLPLSVLENIIQLPHFFLVILCLIADYLTTKEGG